MSFPWLQTTRPRDGGDRRTHVALAELAARAGTFYRLGFTEAAATARLVARVAWEYEPASKVHQRPAALSDAAIAKVVAETYARRPG
jgi:hypothetical protein